MGNETLHIAICDDCKEEQILIRKALQKAFGQLSRNDTSFVVDIKLFQKGKELYDSTQENEYDMIFLDIEMPEWDGFEIAELLNVNRQNTSLFFVSNHENYVFHAQDYLPLGFIRKRYLESDLKRMMRLHFRSQFSKETIYKIKTRRKEQVVFIKNILYVECRGHDLTYVMLPENRSIDSIGTLKSVEEELAGQHFLRIHQNCLVSQRYVKSMEGRMVLLKTGESLEVARDRRKQVMEAMRQYWEESYGNG